MKWTTCMFRLGLTLATFSALLLSPALAQQQAEKEGAIRKKVFVFKYGEHVTAAQIDSVKADFLSLPALVDGMISAEWGTDTKKSQKHCLILTFTSDEAHQRYANHPVHKALGSKYGHLMAEGFSMEIVNYWVKP